MDSKKVSEVVSSLKTVDYVTVSKVLGVDATEISRVIKELIA